MAISFKRAEVVFGMRIIGVAEIVKDFDCLDDSSDGFGT
jgi:hypothetical protein